MQEAFDMSDAALEPQSALLSAFQQRLQALDVPEPLSAVVSHGSWPPVDAISIHETAFQLALPMSPTGSGGGSIVRKRKGASSLPDRGRPLRKSKAQGVLAAVAPLANLSCGLRLRQSVMSTDHEQCHA